MNAQGVVRCSHLLNLLRNTPTGHGNRVGAPLTRSPDPTLLILSGSPWSTSLAGFARKTFMAIITFSLTCEAISRTFSRTPTPITHAPIDRMEDVVGADNHKRARVEGHKDNHKEDSKASGSSSTPARDMKEILGNLPSTVGQGEHQRPIIEALAIGIRDLSMDVQDMKSVITHSWEFPPDTAYVDQGMKFKDQYSKDCRAAKGTGKDLGHQKNYIFLGIYVAYRADRDNPTESKEFR